MKKLIAALLVCLLLAGCSAGQNSNDGQASAIRKTDKSTEAGRVSYQVIDKYYGAEANYNLYSDQTRLSTYGLSYPTWEENCEDGVQRICTALTTGSRSEGYTYNKIVVWTKEADGGWSYASKGIELIDPVEDLDTLTGLSPEEASALLGPCEDSLSDFGIVFWFTKDGKMICLKSGKAGIAYDFLIYSQSVDDPNTVMIDDDNIQNKERLDAFIQTTAKGNTDSIKLTMNGQFAALSYNGTVYTVTDQNGKSASYSHLIVDDVYRLDHYNTVYTDVYYILSDDPEMSYDHYLLTDRSAPDFPRTLFLFTIKNH